MSAGARAWSRAALVLAFAALGAVAARLVAARALGDVPHVMDEIAYLFQAKTFAAGRLTAPVALPRAAFALWFVDDRWAKFSIFPPGWPAVLAIGVKLGAARWVNPILHAATTPIVAAAAARLGGPRARVPAAAMYALSPQAVILAASFMSHGVVALGAALALWAGAALASNRTRPRARARALVALAGGAGVGIALLARPLCGVVAAIALFAPPIVSRDRAAAIRPLLAAIVPIAFAVALLGAYNHALTGHATRFPQTAWFDEHLAPDDDPFFAYHPGCNALGLGPGHGCDTSIRAGYHDVANALSNTGDNLTSWAFLAGGGPLVFLFAIYGALAGRSRKGPRAAALLVPLAAIVLYALYWYAGTCFGARFYHAGLPALIALAAAGASRAWTALRHRLVPLVAFVIVAYALLGAAGFTYAYDELAHGYWGTDTRFAHLVVPAPRALVMIAFAEKEVPMHRMRVTAVSSKDKAVWHDSVRALSALRLDGPWLDEQPIAFAKYHPRLVAELRARHPGRALFVYVMHARPADDELAPYEGSRFAALEGEGPEPAPNFGGYVVPSAAAGR